MQFPIELNGKRLNTVQAIWTRTSNEIKDEEYNEFYQYVGHDHENPLYRLHFTADAPLAIQALLFVPPRNFETLGMARTESEVQSLLPQSADPGQSQGIVSRNGCASSRAWSTAKICR